MLTSVNVHGASPQLVTVEFCVTWVPTTTLPNWMTSRVVQICPPAEAVVAARPRHNTMTPNTRLRMPQYRPGHGGRGLKRAGGERPAQVAGGDPSRPVPQVAAWRMCAPRRHARSPAFAHQQVGKPRGDGRQDTDEHDGQEHEGHEGDDPPDDIPQWNVGCH